MFSDSNSCGSVHIIQTNSRLIGCLIEVKMIHWILSVYFDFIDFGADTKPANTYKLQSQSMKLGVLHHFSSKETRIVSPCAEVTSICQVLSCLQIGTLSPIAKAVFNLTLINHKSRKGMMNQILQEIYLRSLVNFFV
jgi:hypothetical protein